jgi:Tfp pilus assembly protein PilX
MKSLIRTRFKLVRTMKQRGVVLFFALIALVVMSLAAVALIRSVDTSTLIAGNLAFKQANTTSADAGTEAAMVALAAMQAAAGSDVYTNATNIFNVTVPANGYYSNADDTNPNLFADATWNAITVPEVTDTSGNRIRYIIQRMCRLSNQVLSRTNCMFGSAAVDNNGMAIPLPQDICTGPGCPSAGQAAQYRITTRVTGPKNSVSYIQSFVY